jgi:hypothetical protein
MWFGYVFLKLHALKAWLLAYSSTERWFSRCGASWRKLVLMSAIEGHVGTQMLPLFDF